LSNEKGREGNEPRNRQQKRIVDLNHGGKHANDEARGDQHDEHPKVELDGGPVVFVHTLDDAALVDERAASDRGGHCGGWQEGLAAVAVVVIEEEDAVEVGSGGGGKMRWWL
jgi:hypothetical protein